MKAPRPHISGKNNSFYDKKHTKKSLKKISDATKGKNNPNYGRCGEKHPMYNMRSEDHYNWKGGISCEPYCQDWTKEYKEYIRERDNNECQNPECWGKCNHITMTVHHIDYDKKNCAPENLITLCRSCNSRANKDRQTWQELYSTAIEIT